MKKITYTIFALGTLISLSFAAHAAGNSSALSQDKQAIDSACTADAATAGCGSEVVGKGLLKCLHAYKKANPSFKFSDGCKAAMKQFHADKKSQ